MCSAVFEQFKSVTFLLLSEIVLQLQPANYPLDSIPSRLFKEVFITVGSIILTSLHQGCAEDFRGARAQIPKRQIIKYVGYLE